MRKIPKKYWDMTFKEWIRKIKLIEKGFTPSFTAAECGYCIFYKEKYGYCVCPLREMGVCGDKIISILSKLMKNNDRFLNEKIKRPKTSLKQARKIFQAIIDDGRKCGYVGEKEEVIIKQTTGLKG